MQRKTIYSIDEWRVRDHSLHIPFYSKQKNSQVNCKKFNFKMATLPVYIEAQINQDNWLHRQYSELNEYCIAWILSPADSLLVSYDAKYVSEQFCGSLFTNQTQDLSCNMLNNEACLYLLDEIPFFVWRSISLPHRRFFQRW